MDRLTKRFPGGYGLVKVKDNEQVVDSKYPNTLRAILESFERLGTYEDTGLMPEEIAALQAELENVKEELAVYKQAERENKYVVLPCTVGDTVYTNRSWNGDYERSKDKPYAHKIVFIGINGGKDFFNTRSQRTERMYQFDFSDIGKTVFLTREEAESALKGSGQHE